jgi:hypothetical protein
MITLLVLILIVGIFAPIKALAEDDYAEAIVGSNIYKFDWDYIVSFGDNNPEDLNIEKNLNDREDIVIAKEGTLIDAIVHTCCGDFAYLNVSIADDVTVTIDGQIKIFNEKPAVQVGGCHDEDCKQTWQIPDVNKKMYKLIYYVIGETEVNEIYITQIIIS